jgi:hypothetical protein
LINFSALWALTLKNRPEITQACISPTLFYRDNTAREGYESHSAEKSERISQSSNPLQGRKCGTSYIGPVMLHKRDKALRLRAWVTVWKTNCLFPFSLQCVR